MTQAKKGDTIKMNFTGKTEEGNVFGTTEGKEPLEFKLGEGQLIPGVENAIEGMNEGDKKTVELTPEKGYGDRKQELVQEVEKEKFPTDIEPEVGQMFEIPQPNGQKMLVTIADMSDDKITLDGNHPLAGKKLTFDLEVLEVK